MEASIQDGKCHLCDLDEVNNEMHFIFYCPFSHDLRVKLFLKISVLKKHPILFDMSDEFTYKTFDIVQFLLNVHTRRTPLYDFLFVSDIMCTGLRSFF